MIIKKSFNGLFIVELFKRADKWYADDELKTKAHKRYVDNLITREINEITTFYQLSNDKVRLLKNYFNKELIIKVMTERSCTYSMPYILGKKISLQVNNDASIKKIINQSGNGIKWNSLFLW